MSTTITSSTFTCNPTLATARDNEMEKTLNGRKPRPGPHKPNRLNVTFNGLGVSHD